MKKIAALTAILLNVSLASASELCGDELMPASPALFCSYHFGLKPGDEKDISSELQSALTLASEQKKGIFFPHGKYKILNQVLVKNHNSIIGSTFGATIFSGPPPNKPAILFGDLSYGPTVGDLEIKGIIFDNIWVGFFGTSKKNIEINYNVFINTNRKEEQLSAAHVPFVIKGNIFMRGRYFPGVGLSTYANKIKDGKRLVVEGNFLGSLDLINKAANYIDDSTKLMIEKLTKLRLADELNFDDDQGNFIAGWYSTSGLNGGLFYKNFFSGNTLQNLWNPQTKQYDIIRDHNIYIKQYDDVDVIQNYFGGWPDTAEGQLKFRNAENLTFAANHLERISFNARPYDTSPNMYMRNTYIFNNYIAEGIINYWQNFTDTPEKNIDIKDYFVFDNIFSALDKKICRISSTWRSIHPEQFKEANNLYLDASKVISCDGMIQETSDYLKENIPIKKQAYLSLKPLN